MSGWLVEAFARRGDSASSRNREHHASRFF